MQKAAKSISKSTGLKDLCLEGSNITTIGDFAFADVNNCYDFVIPEERAGRQLHLMPKPLEREAPLMEVILIS